MRNPLGFVFVASYDEERRGLRLFSELAVSFGPVVDQDTIAQLVPTQQSLSTTQIVEESDWG